MKSSKIVFFYLLLSMVLIGSAVVLAYQVRHYLYERQDPIAKYENYKADDEYIAEEFLRKEEEDRKTTLLVYDRTLSFRALATPVPQPTATPRPPNTPTPVLAGKGYKILYVMSNWVSLRSYNGDVKTVQVGQTVEETLGNFKIVSAKSNPPSVTVQDIKTGQSRTIVEVERK